jgi:2,3,4,5-tetrahydropyridine-2-carboxylate N-succinyltransferase
MNIFPLIALGECTTDLGGDILDVRYQQISFKDTEPYETTSYGPWGKHYNGLEGWYEESKNNNFELSLQTQYEPEYALKKHEEQERTAGVTLKKTIIHKLEKDEPIRNVKDAYLKLYLLSELWSLPNSLNLEGIFSALPNVAWTNHGPMHPDTLEEAREMSTDFIHVTSLDKFPCLTDYIIPKGVRIADASRVRLGAYLSEGTTVMHEGFINFNAGTLGPAMIEGRISAGVVVGKNSDLGGGCSTMGTLSGGNDVKISVGEDCLLGANSGLGIPLGDRCTLEAGLYLTGGSKVEVLDQNNNLIETLKASELSLKPDLLFIRNSLSGAIQCKPNKKSIVLNDQLHSND